MNTNFKYILLVLFLFSGCGSDNSSPPIEEETLSEAIERNRELWESNQDIEYSIHYTKVHDRYCFPNNEEAFIWVVDGEVDHVIDYVDTDYFEDNPKGFPTIDEIFDELESFLEYPPLELGKSVERPDLPIEFNEEYGYPTVYYVKRNNKICQTYTITISL